MTDTIQKIADDLAVANERLKPTDLREYIDGVTSRLRALSARASAGEGEPVWKFVGTEKRPIEQEYEVGVMPKVPKPIEWETLYFWEAKVAAITKNGKPPVTAASAGEGGAECGESLARNEAFNLADTVIEHIRCGQEQKARDAIMEAFTTSQTAATQGGEWVMVPRLPTPEMLMAAGEAVHNATYWAAAYRAMLAAAPQPQKMELPTYTELAEAGVIGGCNGRHPAEYRCYEGCKVTPPAHGDGEVTDQMIDAAMLASLSLDTSACFGWESAIRARMSAAITAAMELRP